MSRNKVFKECSVPKCMNIARVKGWCEKHYNRQRKTGSLYLKPKIIKGSERTKEGLKETKEFVPLG